MKRSTWWFLLLAYGISWSVSEIGFRLLPQTRYMPTLIALAFMFGPALAAVFISQYANIDLSLTQYLIIALASVLGSFGTAGVPGTAVIMATHNMELVRRNEYRVLEVNRGQLAFDSDDQQQVEKRAAEGGR